MIRVVLADDHPVVRAGLRALLDAQSDMTVVAEYATAEELLAADPETDVVLTDLRFGEGRLGGAEAARRIVAAGGPPVLVLTTYDSDADIVTAVEAGATGYVLKDAPTEELAAAIRDAAAGRPALGPAVQRRLLQRMRAPGVSLSPRELEVLELVAQGRSNDDIAVVLFLSKATVKTHLAHIFEKLDVTSRTAAVAVARQRGILD
ncbi:response regulator transcription factor [Aeromicrobium piscarium]|uniref:Response regulator transcription factor n=1 Tax=Aeromicrobium piscarium TaxID=2590901 RepID=A0A554RX92_9ACTN|nr:response regulator transcription factor [Aeromicrobium piscarium]TSD58716.1 response regulator transcription factor [Aeromicrobium piscarium]